MSEQKPSVIRRLGSLVVKVLSLFVILEPIWMLLPFAGFLYGSVLRIQTLNQNPRTAWLTHFVFPVLTGGLLGPVLVVLGFVLFCVGAGQIYTAKIRKSGLVTGGLYRLVRHPQYIALTFFGLGILLTWGRAITFIAFFVMMFLYYYLARSEERTCVRLFGEAYERYRERTSFVFPGDKYLRPLAARVPGLRLPATARVAAAFVVMLAACFALIWLIDLVKESLRQVPYLVAEVPLGPAEAGAGPEIRAVEANGVPFVCSERIAVARGPYRNAWASGFAEGVLRRLPRSPKLRGFLGARRGGGFLWALRAARQAGHTGHARRRSAGGSRSRARPSRAGPREADHHALLSGRGGEPGRRARRQGKTADHRRLHRPGESRTPGRPGPGRGGGDSGGAAVSRGGALGFLPEAVRGPGDGGPTACHRGRARAIRDGPARADEGPYPEDAARAGLRPRDSR